MADNKKKLTHKVTLIITTEISFSLRNKYRELKHTFKNNLNTQ
jgi:hypothetical protein